MLQIITVYKNPLDYPDKFVVRPFEITLKGPKPKELVYIGNNMKDVREFKDKHYPFTAILMRDKSDEPQIVESWI